MKYPRYCIHLVRAGVASAALLAASSNLLAQATVDSLEKENQDLKSRLDKLENLVQKEGIMPSGDAATPSPVKALTEINISGFVSASYFYDVASSRDTHPNGYLWNTTLNSFTVNEFKLTLASPAPDKDKWDAAYRVSMIYGTDAKIVDTGNFSPGFSTIPIREAFVELNIPVGTGIDIRAGELISLLNYESGDGGAANANFSQGYQWYYTGNPPNAGVQAAYDFNEMFGLKARLQNGLYNGPYSVGPKTFMGGFYVHPDKKTSLAFLGFEGRQSFAGTEPSSIDTPAFSYDVFGGSFIGSRVLTEKYNLTFATEFDWFELADIPAPAVSGVGPSGGRFYSIGGWLTADVTEKMGLALRADFIDDPTGLGTGGFNSPSPTLGQGYVATAFPAALASGLAGQNLNSVTLTLNYKPAPQIKLMPEIRWNHSTYAGALNGKRDQVIMGMGAVYLF